MICTDLNSVLRGIFGSKRDGVTGEWRRLHTKELYDLYSSPNIFLLIKSRRVGWTGHVARMGEGRCACRILVGRPEGKNHLENLGVDEGIMLKEIFKWDERAWIGLIWLRIGTGGGLL
jgi:hypothetical protein